MSRQYPSLPVAIPPPASCSPGGASWTAGGGDFTEAAVVAQFLTQQGVPDGRVILEDRAQSTRENAVFSLPLARPQPGEHWLLVTSAMHMPRAIGVFRGAGWPVLQPWPVDYRTTGRMELSGEPIMSTRLADLDQAAYEWYGLLYYRLLGYTADIFPGPAGA